MDNLRGFGPSDGFADGWTSSAAPAVEELLRTRGRQNTSQWDCQESRSLEALKIVLDQGFSSVSGEHAGRPETRGFTIGHAGHCEFFAEIYTDVVLDPARWNLEGESAQGGCKFRDRVDRPRPAGVDAATAQARDR
ncbi:hypothetical protein AB0H92_01345 [Streptomyces phaeochromogenes]|uniref:hypothetical protein n=1 Tax=Streptomyces phaeochromogenes TaxID=1923 RepID=UPI0033C567E7